MNCDQVSEKLSAFIDDELSPQEQVQIQQHVSMCVSCRSQTEQFVAIGDLMRRSEATEVALPSWEVVEQGLVRAAILPVETKVDQSKWIYAALATAASLALLWFALSSLRKERHGEHELAEHAHTNMTVDFQDVLQLAQTNPKTAIGKLIAKYDGKELDRSATIDYLGYEPALFKALPVGFTRTSTHVLNMPCCKCSATICQRSDGSSLVVFEHKEEQPVWFGEAPSIETQCAGRTCRIIESAGNLAVAWKNNGRQLTLIGARDNTEADQWVATLNL